VLIDVTDSNDSLVHLSARLAFNQPEIWLSQH